MISNPKLDGGSAWLDYLTITIVAVSIVSIALLISDAFNPRIALLLGGLLSTGTFFFVRQRAVALADIGGVGSFSLVAIVLLASLFRAEPYPWIHGGQDQGVYVSMSAYFQAGGGVFIADPIFGKLNQAGLADVYRATLPQDRLQLGVYYGGAKDYVFQFYHLHPLWMAIFADLFGDEARLYSLTFFSLLSIVFLSLLTFELSNSRAAALSVGILLAINPLHTFFSKWPVTEVVALAFSSMALYYLARAWRLAHSVFHARWALVIAALSLSMLFFVRITGFFYLPLLLLLFMLGSWLQKVRGEGFGRDLALFAVGCMVLYVSSVFYGLHFSEPYSAGIYRLTVGMVTDRQWEGVLLALLGAMAFLMYVWHAHFCAAQAARRLSAWITPRAMVSVLTLIAGTAALISLYQVYRLGYTDHYASHPWLGKRWELSGTGIAAVERASVLNWLIYSSPFLAVAGVIGLLRSGTDLRLALLLLVPVTSLGLFLLGNPVLPYQYYYARYLVSEAVPYAIVVFVVATVGSHSVFWRKLGLAVVVLSAPWFGFATVKQFGAEEGVRPLNVLRQVAAHVADGDVLLIEPSGWSIAPVVVQTPLQFYFGIGTVLLPESDRKKHRKRLSEAFRRVWLLSPKPIFDPNYLLADRLLHYDKVVERVAGVPLKIVDDYWRQELYLYELKKFGWPSGQGEPPRLEPGVYSVGVSPEVAAVLGRGWHSIERRHVWSSASAELVFDAEGFKDGHQPRSAILHVGPFAASAARPVAVMVSACGGFRREFHLQSNDRVKLRIPLSFEGDRKRCGIYLEVPNATSPAALGMSVDSRVLGLALGAIELE